jgi:hypothetical protein
VETNSYTSISRKFFNGSDYLIAVGSFILLIGLPFHLVIKSLIPGLIGSYWKEFLLGALVVIWCLQSIVLRRPLLTRTPLDIGIGIYIAVVTIGFLKDPTNIIRWWGLYISLLYLPLVFLIRAVLKRFPQLWMPFIVTLVSVGGIVAVGGLVEFLIDRSLWPSAEVITRQGFPDVYVYGTHLRRVYFVFDSPTTLANTLGMLVPLAFALFFSVKRLYYRIAAGIAAVLMVACILLTFSRGIWVALALSIILVLLYQWVLERNRTYLIAVTLSGLAVLALGIGFLLLRPTPAPNTNAYSIELTAAEYNQIPMGSLTEMDLLTPQNAPVEFQQWSLYDALDQKEDSRKVAYTPPTALGPGELVSRVTIPESGAFRFSIAFNPEVWVSTKGDGANFQVLLSDPSSGGSSTVVFQRYINPKGNPSDRRWRNYLVDLAQWSGKPVNITLRVDAGPRSDYGFDWVGWADTQIGSVSPAIFQAHRSGPSNPVVDHLASVSDWTQDETNRDRLMAWNLSFATWGSSPIWGNGLGTTGAAALRTMPEKAFVTESQLLKSLVELGIPGVASWAILWGIILVVAYRAHRNERKVDRRWILLGILGSMLIVFIEGMVYQNLEAKQVNAIFWTLIGLLGFFAADQNKSLSD